MKKTIIVASLAIVASMLSNASAKQAVTLSEECVSLSDKGKEYLAREDRESLEAAAHSFKKAIEAQYDCVPALIGYAEAMSTGKGFQIGFEDFTRSYEYILRAIVLDPTSAHAHWVLADLLRHTQQMNVAASVAERAISLDPNDPWAHYILASSLLQSKPDRAIAEFNKALELKPGWKRVSLNLAAAYLNLHKPKEARAILEAIIAEDSSNINALTNMGIAHFMEGDLDKALEYLEKALSIDATFPMALKTKADALTMKKDYKAAIETYNRFLQIIPNDVNVIVLMGDAYALSGDVENARTSYSRALSLKPNDKEIAAKIASLAGK